MIRPAELIERKRDGGHLTPEEIDELVLGHLRGEIPDYQLAAFCMAVYFRGMAADETLALTDAFVGLLVPDVDAARTTHAREPPLRKNCWIA